MSEHVYDPRSCFPRQTESVICIVLLKAEVVVWTDCFATLYGWQFTDHLR